VLALPPGSTVAFVAANTTIDRLNAASGTREAFQSTEDRVYALAASRDGRYLAAATAARGTQGWRRSNDASDACRTGRGNGSVRVWDLRSRELVWSTALEFHAPPQVIAWSREGVLVAVGNADRICLLDAADGALVRGLDVGVGSWVTSPGFDSLTSRLAAGTWKSRTALFELPREGRDPATVQRWVDRHVPWKLVDGQLQPNALASSPAVESLNDLASGSSESATE
jgi:hypothetical protein